MTKSPLFWGVISLLALGSAVAQEDPSVLHSSQSPKTAFHSSSKLAAAREGESHSAVTAFVNVSVAPLDHEGVVPGQTVVVRNGSIAAIGSADATPVPKDAVVIQGNGHYLMPGLADMHVHL